MRLSCIYARMLLGLCVLLGTSLSTIGQSSRSDGDGVFVKSWKAGDTRVLERTVTLKLERDVPAYELSIYDSSKQRHFRLHLQQAFARTLRNPALPCWSAVLTEVTKDGTTGADIIGNNLLSREGPGVGDYFPREDWSTFLCPIEKPNSVLDGQLYPIRAARRFSIERFFLSLQVRDYTLNQQENRMEQLVLEIEFKNK